MPGGRRGGNNRYDHHRDNEGSSGVSGSTGSETRKLRIDGWNLVRDDQAGRERWLVANDDGEVRAHIEIERHRALPTPKTAYP